MKAVIGLGNPGNTYKNNRHNVGFMAVDAFCKGNDLIFEKKNRYHAQVAVSRDGSCRNFLVKPLTYMNLSGTSVVKFMEYHKLELQDILVVYDDFNLPLGRLRIRMRGSSGGHNGMKSIIQQTGTREFSRLRIGVGSDMFVELKSRSEKSVTSFVLGNFSKEDKVVLKDIMPKTVDIIRLFFRDELRTAMNLYNAGEKKE